MMLERLLKKQHAFGKAICPNCGKEFEKSTETHIYCCEMCRRQANNREANKRRADERKALGIYGIQAISKENPAEMTCVICGKKFMAGSKAAKYCSPQCRQKGNRDAKNKYVLRQAELERARLRNKSFIKTGKKQSLIYSEGKLWDDNDPECKAVMAYLKTVEPIDWEAENRLLEQERLERLRREAEDPKTHQGKYVRRNLCLKHGLK